MDSAAVTELERWMIETRDKLSRGHDLSKAFNYMLRRWSSFTRFLDDGRTCLSNNAAERARESPGCSVGPIAADSAPPSSTA